MIADLKNLYQGGRLLPFVGAGVSMSVEWLSAASVVRGVSWNELVSKACELLGVSDPLLLRARGTDLQILEYFRLANGGLAQLTNWMYAQMQAPDAALLGSRIHKELSALDKCPVFYTTNYDDFLERSFKLAGRGCRVVAEETALSKPSVGTDIVKFHGDFSHPETMVLSESDYEKRLALSTAVDLKLQADMLGRAVLFLGYSFRDPNISYIFHLVKRRFDSLPGTPAGYRAYIAIPEPSRFELLLFKERNIGVIHLDAEGISDGIVELLEQIRS